MHVTLVKSVTNNLEPSVLWGHRGHGALGLTPEYTSKQKNVKRNTTKRWVWYDPKAKQPWNTPARDRAMKDITQSLQGSFVKRLPTETDNKQTVWRTQKDYKKARKHTKIDIH